MKKLFFLHVILLLVLGSHGQSDSSALSGIFERITGEISNYQIDTTAVPNDKITKKITQLRELGGGFNINEAVTYKLEEEERKKEMPQVKIDRLKREFQNGKAKIWLDNATNRIYRQHFTYKELKQLVKFYKTKAGKKIAANFPVIMMKTMMVAELIQKVISEETEQSSK